MWVDPRRAVRAAVAMVSALAAAAAFGCADSEPRPESAATAEPASRAFTSAETAAWYQACWGHFNSRAWDKLRSCYADTVESDQVDSGHPAARGLEAAMAVSKGFTEAFPDVKGTGELILVNGAAIVGVYLLTGTNAGSMLSPDGQSIPATNKPIGLYQAHHLRTDASGARVVKEEFYSDTATMMAQLGLSPGPSRPVASRTKAAPTVVLAAGTPAELSNVELTRAQMAAYNSHDRKGVDAYAAPVFVYHDLTMPADQTAAQVSASTEAYFKAFPDVKLVPLSIWGAGDYVVVIGRFEGTNKGPMPAMGLKKASNKSVSVRYLDITRWENGKAKEEWLFYDGMAMSRQLGLVGKK